MIFDIKANNRRADFVKYFKNTYGLFLDFHKYNDLLLITLRTNRNEVVDYVDILRGNTKIFAPLDFDFSLDLELDLKTCFGD